MFGVGAKRVRSEPASVCRVYVGPRGGSIVGPRTAGRRLLVIREGRSPEFEGETGGNRPTRHRSLPTRQGVRRTVRTLENLRQVGRNRVAGGVLTFRPSRA